MYPRIRKSSDVVKFCSLFGERERESESGPVSNGSETLPGATASCALWRTTDAKYGNNEVYVDLVEEMDPVINRHAAENLLMRSLRIHISFLKADFTTLFPFCFLL